MKFSVIPVWDEIFFSNLMHFSNFDRMLGFPKRRISPLNKLQKIMRTFIKADLPNLVKKNWVNIMRS